MMKVTKDTYRQAVTIFPVGLSLFIYGCAYGWVAPALEYFNSKESPFKVSENELTWIASSFFLAEIISPLISGLFAEKFGRKSFFIFASLLHTVSWIFLVIGNSTSLILISRFLMGTSGGIFDQAWSQYSGEVTSPNKRGIFTSLLISIFVGGVMLQFLLNLFASYNALVIVPFILNVFNLITCFFMVESPIYLLMKNKEELALKTVAWLQGKDTTNVQTEFEEIKLYLNQEIESTRISIKEMFSSRSECKLCTIGIIIFILLQSSGNAAIVAYQTIIFELFKDFTNENNYTAIYGVLQFISAIIAPFLIEIAGRRILLITGFAISIFTQAINTSIFYIAQKYNFEIPYAEQILLISFNLYGIVFMICLFPTAFVLKSELFSRKLKTFGSVVSTIMNSLAHFIVLKPFMLINKTFGMYINFAFYLLISILGIIYAIFLVPETKGKSLANIQLEYERKNKETNINNFEQNQEKITKFKL